MSEALLSLVAAVESQPKAGPAVKAFQAAIRCRGEGASSAGGREAMEAALRIVDKAWSGLPGWRS